MNSNIVFAGLVNQFDVVVEVPNVFRNALRMVVLLHYGKILVTMEHLYLLYI
jgi:hypothetical protein